jgi:2-phosphosulfolactate phosphatase
MDEGLWAQRDYGVRFEWGLVGAQRIADPRAAVVVIDVLSFSTTVSIAVNAGTWVYPCVWGSEQATIYGEKVGAAVAVGRSEVDVTHPYSLSPASIIDGPATARLVLPSPNGSTIALNLGSDGAVAQVLIGSLRNAHAVGTWLASHHFGSTERPICIVAAGERWPDDSLRPALEDYLGAGAVLNALAHAGLAESARWSPEARLTLAAYAGTPDVANAVRLSGSGRELIERGYERDIELAVVHGADTAVPLLINDAFRDALHLD